MCIVCVRVCALLSRSLVTVSGRLATREFRHQETITPPTNSTPNKVVEVNYVIIRCVMLYNLAARAFSRDPLPPV